MRGETGEKIKKNFKQLGEDICSAGTSIDDDNELLKLGQSLRDTHKDIANDLNNNYIGSHIDSPSHYAVRSLLPSDEVTNVMGTYCAAYFNLGVSFEHMRQFKLSGQAFERALYICKMHMPNNTALMLNLQ